MMYGSVKCADRRSIDVTVIGNVCFAFIANLQARPSFQASTYKDLLPWKINPPFFISLYRSYGTPFPFLAMLSNPFKHSMSCFTHSLPAYADVSVSQSSPVDEDSNERPIQLAEHI